jgi:hypothetical protein
LISEPLNIGANEAFIRVYNVQRRATYTVDFYDTETGLLIESRNVKSGRGMLKIYAPTLLPSERYDVAFKFYDSSMGWK